jgi:hypothetical protein
LFSQAKILHSQKLLLQINKNIGLAITIEKDPRSNVMPICLAWKKSIKLSMFYPLVVKYVGFEPTA